MSEEVFITLPNEGEIPFSVDLIAKWNPTNVREVGNTIFFTYGGSSFSMRKEDFETHFNNKKDKE